MGMKSFRHILIFAGLLLLYLLSSASSGKNFVYNDQGRRDPFFPLVDANGRVLMVCEDTTKVGDLQLEGILWDSEEDSFVIINGEIFAEGESIGDFRVIKIEKTQVTLSRNNEKCILKLEEED